MSKINKIEQEYIDGLNVALSQPSYNCINKFELSELNKIIKKPLYFHIDKHTVTLCEIVVRQELNKIIKIINKLQDRRKSGSNNKKAVGNNF
tara:strand:- start:1285 stop:1560 length:276 start_codon:yes stop_codon:yes gene_type:complete